MWFCWESGVNVQGTVLLAWKAASNNDHLDVPTCKLLANLALAKHRETRQQGRPNDFWTLSFDQYGKSFPQFGMSGFPDTLQVGPASS